MMDSHVYPRLHHKTDFVQWRSELLSCSIKFDKLTERYRECIALSIKTAETLDTIKDITEKYNNLHQLKKSFSNKQQNLVKKSSNN